MTHSVNELINHEAVCRTAPATPGLSKSVQGGGGQTKWIFFVVVVNLKH